MSIVVILLMAVAVMVYVGYPLWTQGQSPKDDEIERRVKAFRKARSRRHEQDELADRADDGS